MRVKALTAQRFLDEFGRLGRYDAEGGEDTLQLVDPETIREISRLLATVTEGDSDERLIAGLNGLLGDPEEFEAAVVVWIDLLYVLVAAVETRYPEKDRGPTKKEEVKGAVVFILRTGRFDIPSVPAYLEPVLVDALADFLVDAIVELANTYDAVPLRAAHGMTWADVWRAIRKAVWFLLTPVLWLGSRIYLALRTTPRLSPALRNALAAVERDGMIARGPTPLERTFDLVLWIGHNRDTLIAGVHLTALVVQEVERFETLESDDKKLYARELIFAVLEEEGWVPPGPLVEAKMIALIDAAIEGVVHVFNKGGTFGHVKPRRDRSGPAAWTPGAPPPPALRATGRRAPPRTSRRA